MRLLRYNHPRFEPDCGFTLAEVLIAITVSVLFGLAAFATNERLLVGLRTQRESAAATMMLQERMETLRALTFYNLTDSNYILTSLLADSSKTPTNSEAPLGNLTETITISAYPSDGSTNNQWVRNSTYASGHANSTNTTLSTSHGGTQTVVKADILVTWTSANGRTRTRNLAALCGIGNLGQ
jgi:prepilin-type N-terminal cleavage/methylation domain-containing protein